MLLKRQHLKGRELPTFLLRFHNFKLVAVIPDPQDHCWPISTTPYNLERLDAFTESIDVDDTATTWFESKATEECVLDERSAVSLTQRWN